MSGSSEWTDGIADKIPVMETGRCGSCCGETHFHLFRFLIDLRVYEELCVHTISEPR